MRCLHTPTTMAAVCCLVLAVAACEGTNRGSGSLPPASPSSASEAVQSHRPSASFEPKPIKTTTEDTASSVPKPSRHAYRHINEKTEAGATDALAYFIEGYRYSLITRDPSVIAEMAGPRCNACQEMITDIQHESQRFSVINWTIEDRFVELGPDGIAPGAFTIRSTATPLGSDSSTSVTETIYIGGKMTWLNGHWVINHASIELEDE